MKFQRQAKILDLIDRFEIETQEDLTAHLRALGYNTTQATISRDIKELRLIKNALLGDRQVQVYLLERRCGGIASPRVCATFSESASQILMRHRIWSSLKHCPVWDRRRQWRLMPWRAPDVVGTLGGDDTVFAVMRDNDSAQKFCTQARDILK